MKVGVKGPGIRRVLLFRRLVQPPRYAISAEARGVYRRRGRAQREDEERMEGERGEEGDRVEEAWYARAVVWMRGLGFDPKSETEIEGTRRSKDCSEGAGGREGTAVERRGEEHRGERGKRVGRVGFAGSPLLIFPVRLTASPFRSWSSFFLPQSHSHCFFPSSPGVPVPRIRPLATSVLSILAHSFLLCSLAR